MLKHILLLLAAGSFHFSNSFADTAISGDKVLLTETHRTIVLSYPDGNSDLFTLSMRSRSEEAGIGDQLIKTNISKETVQSWCDQHRSRKPSPLMLDVRTAMECLIDEASDLSACKVQGVSEVVLLRTLQSL